MNALNINLTPNEVAALKGYLASEYFDCDKTLANKDRFLNGTWTFSVSANYPGTPRSFSGVASSLVKKGMVLVSDPTPGEPNSGITQMTQQGWAAVCQYGLITDYPALVAGQTAKAPTLTVVPTSAPAAAPAAAPAPAEKPSNKKEFNISGITKEGKILFQQNFKSVSKMNALWNAEDWFKKNNIDVEAAHALQIVEI